MSSSLCSSRTGGGGSGGALAGAMLAAAVMATAMVCGSAGVWAQPLPSACVFYDQWQGFVQLESVVTAVDQLNVTCPTDNGPLLSYRIAADPMLQVSLNFDLTASVGQLTVQAFANSPPWSWVNITWTDALQHVLVTPLLVNVTFRGIPKTLLTAYPPDPADTHIRTVASGDVVSYQFAYTNARPQEVLPSATHLTPMLLTTHMCDMVTYDTDNAWADKLTAEQCADGGNAFPCTRNLTFRAAADDSSVGLYTYCLQEHDGFYLPYCTTSTAASGFPVVTTPTSGCICVNFQVLSRGADPNHNSACATGPGDDGHGKGLSGGQIAAAVIIPVVALVVLIGIAVWRQKTRAAVSDKGHVRMTDDSTLNSTL